MRQQRFLHSSTGATLVTIVLLVVINLLPAGQQQLTSEPSRMATTEMIRKTNNTVPISDDRLMPGTKDHFDCDLQVPPTVDSAIFYPKRFFENGSGRQFLPFYNTMSSNHFGHLEHPRFITIKQAAREVETTTQANSTACGLIYYHIHKNGGTTVHKALNKVSSLSTQPYYAKDERRLGSKRFQEITRSTFLEAYQQQADPARPPIPIFTFVRDPLMRFLSGLAQFLTNNGGPNGGIYACHANATETVPMLECVVQLIHDRQSFLNVHLQPQAYEIYKAVVYDDAADLAFTLYNIKDMSPVLGALGVESISQNRQRSKGLLRGKFNLTSTAILTPELKKRICELYAMDVLMLRETGILLDHTECDDVLDMSTEANKQ